MDGATWKLCNFVRAHCISFYTESSRGRARTYLVCHGGLQSKNYPLSSASDKPRCARTVCVSTRSKWKGPINLFDNFYRTALSVACSTILYNLKVKVDHPSNKLLHCIHTYIRVLKEIIINILRYCCSGSGHIITIVYPCSVCKWLVTDDPQGQRHARTLPWLYYFSRLPVFNSALDLRCNRVAISVDSCCLQNLRL